MSASRDRTKPGRSAAEWTSFAVAVVILVALVGAIAVRIGQDARPPAPVARQVGEVRRVGERFVVTVDVGNEGDRTAEEVQVTGSLTMRAGADDEQVVEADQTIDFLSGGEVSQIELVFEDDPATGDLEIRVSSYQLP